MDKARLSHNLMVKRTDRLDQSDTLLLGGRLPFADLAAHEGPAGGTSDQARRQDI